MKKRLHDLNIIFAPVHSSDIENDDACLQAIIYDV